MLKLDRITKHIDNVPILNHVSCQINKGEIVSVIGPSGSGKTSLLRVAGLIESADSGTWSLHNSRHLFPIPTLSNTELPYPRLTVVFQQLFIWPHLTVRDNLLLPLHGNIDTPYFDQITQRFGIASILDRYPNKISLGQKQRAALARALLLKPEFLLLDEVTSALDIEQAHIVLDHLREMATEGVGILFVTHALQHAKKISDRILFMDCGHIIEEGPPSLFHAHKSERLKKFLELG